MSQTVEEAKKFSPCKFICLRGKCFLRMILFLLAYACKKMVVLQGFEPRQSEPEHIENERVTTIPSA